MRYHWLSAGLTALALALAGPAAARSKAVTTLDGRRLSPVQVDADVRELMASNAVVGLDVALIRDGQVVYARAFGERNVEQGLPMTPQTVIYGASLTKATFAYLVMQLVQEGRIDLDRPTADYLPKPLPDYPKYADLAGDARWRRLTFRSLMNHTTGFANFRFLEPDGKLRFHHDPGTRFGYSGEGINLAQFVLEQGLGLDVGAEMQRRIFAPLGMSRTSLTWRADFAGDVADGYLKDGSLKAHHRREDVRAAGSMDTTLDDWSKFLAAVSRGDGLTRRARAELTRRSIDIDSMTQFPTLSEAATDAYRPIRLGYAVGWAVYETPYGHAFFKEGHDDGAGNFALCVQAQRACILLLSNSDRAEGIYKAMVERLLGPVNLPWRWQGYIPATVGVAGVRPAAPRAPPPAPALPPRP
ncbi:serine hydrolase domain-containing protein [Caulobacter sp. KR2-114]|uniref:serine hydrolase domain-containing protein n=1 Tax=Caulobacter sp. KR2-114 TaxID=3400912 RepID=UPI003BFEF19B